MKKCTICLVEMGETCFNVKKRNKTRMDGSIHSWKGLYAACKQCTYRKSLKNVANYKTYYSDYRSLNREKIKAISKKHYIATKKGWWDIVSRNMELKCVECSYSKHSAALEFNHKDPENKGCNIHTMMRKTQTPERVVEFLSELAKCEILCANCHKIHHAKYDFISAEKAVATWKGTR